MTPRLFLFLHHSSSNVRKATLQTLEAIIRNIKIDNSYLINHNEVKSILKIFQKTLHNIFQRVLVEHFSCIQNIAERVWTNMLSQSGIEIILPSVCPIISTWFCLCMQPENLPYNSYQLTNTSQINSKISENDGYLRQEVKGSFDYSYFPSPGYKVYIGGVETVPMEIRHENAIRARCVASKMLGLLSTYIAKSGSIDVYRTEDSDPLICYSNILLTHLKSKSALQKIVVGLTMSSWATYTKDALPTLPQILR